MTEEHVAGLADATISDALNVRAHGVNTSRAIIDGAVVIYASTDPPAWLRPVLHARDEDGSVLKAMDIDDSADRRSGEHHEFRVTYRAGEAITGVAAQS